MDITECEAKGFIKRTYPNISLVKSLLEISKTKADLLESVKFDENTVNAYLPMAYDSLREVLESMCILRGYKVTNHACIGELLRKIDSEFDYASFDRFRYARNGINYYGKKVDFEQGVEMIKKILDMRGKLSLKITKEIK